VTSDKVKNREIPAENDRRKINPESSNQVQTTGISFVNYLLYIMATSRLGNVLNRLRSNRSTSRNQVVRGIATARAVDRSKLVIGLAGVGTIAGIVGLPVYILDQN